MCHVIKEFEGVIMCNFLVNCIFNPHLFVIVNYVRIVDEGLKIQLKKHECPIKLFDYTTNLYAVNLVIITSTIIFTLQYRLKLLIEKSIRAKKLFKH